MATNSWQQIIQNSRKHKEEIKNKFAKIDEHQSKATETTTKEVADNPNENGGGFFLDYGGDSTTIPTLNTTSS